MKNYTIQPNEIFYMNITYEGKLILLYLNSKPKDWIIYKSEVQKTLKLGQTKMNAAWKQLINIGFIIKTKLFGKVDFALNVNAIIALMSIENATRVSARIPNTDVPTITDIHQIRMNKKYVTNVTNGGNS